MAEEWERFGKPIMGKNPSGEPQTIRVDASGKVILSISQYGDAALSGTPVILKIDVSGTPYYWKVYPTKA